MGWGKDAFGPKGKYQESLKQAEVPIINNDKCQDLFRQTRLRNTFRLHDSFLCALGSDGQDACEGDGGGPLVCRDISKPSR